MTNEEAIKILEKMKARIVPLSPLLEGKSKDEEAIDIAIEALEKQIPKPPKMGYAFPEKIRAVMTFRGDNERAEAKTDCCPACGRPLGTSKFVQSQTGMRFGDPYCKRCGQAIDLGVIADDK